MKIDIIIVTYNAKYRLKRCLESIEKNTRGISYIITIVDNASTDSISCFLRNYCKERKNITILYSNKNLGFCGGANLALRNTENRFICLLDDDIEVTEGWLSGLLGRIKNRPKVGIVGCRIVFPSGRIWSADYQIKPLRLIGNGEIDNGQRNYVKECDALIGPCWLMRRELIKTVGYFDERFFPSQHEDIDYCLRTRLGGYKLIYNGEVRIIHHHLFRGEGQFEENRQKFFKKWRSVLNKFPLKDSHPADKYINNGVEFLKRRKFQQSLIEFEKAESVDKRFAEPFYTALAYKGMRKYNEAIREFKKLLGLNSVNLRAHYQLALVYKQIGCFEKARVESGKAVDILCNVRSRDKCCLK